MSDWQIRPAAPTELAAIFDIFYEHEFRHDPAPPPRLTLPYLAHVLATGRLLVAEREGRLLGYAGLIARGEVAFLTDLFVGHDEQSRGLGAALLRAILPPSGVRCTCSSSDPRALALYMRAGMRPQWPQFWLRGVCSTLQATPQDALDVVEGRADDPALADWEEAIGGRARSVDLAFWHRDQRGVPLWFRRGGATVGYALVRLGAATARDPAAAALGPLGVRDAVDATACVLAAADWACGRAPLLQLVVPGPHPALAPLLDAGFTIVALDTFVSSATTPFCDPRRYISSGADLF